MMQKKMRKSSSRFVAVLLAAVLVLGLIPGGLPKLQFAFGAPQPTTPGQSYNIDSLATGDNYNINAGGTYTFYGTTTKNVWITVNTNAEVTIILDNVSITNAMQSPIQLLTTTAPGARVTLDVRGNNTLTCVGTATNVPLAGIYVPSGTSLTIVGDGTLNAKGNAITSGGGNPPPAYCGAGIGGSSGATANSGSITINSPTLTVNATANAITTPIGTSAAAIGGGLGGSNGTVNIISGTVHATSNGGGAAIGGGATTGTNSNNPGTGGTVNISGGIVHATSMYGPGIGGGFNTGNGGNSAGGAGGNITISGGTVYATVLGTLQSTGASAIGFGGNAGDSCNARPGGTIVITGGSVYPTNSTGTISVSQGPSKTPQGGGNVVEYTVTSGPLLGSRKVYPAVITAQDSSGAPIEGVFLTVAVPGPPAYTYTAVTDNNGKAWLWVPLGTYTVSAEKPNDDLVGRGSASFSTQYTTDVANSTLVTTAVPVAIRMGVVRLIPSKTPDDTKVYSGGVDISLMLENTLETPATITNVLWFREPLNSANTYDVATFQTAYNSVTSSGTNLSNGGSVGVDFSLVNGTIGSNLRIYQKTVTQNGRYWFYADFTGAGGAETWAKVGYVDVDNIFTPYTIYERGYAVDYDEYFYGDENAYEALSGGPYGIPYDLDGAVLTNPYGGYDTFTIQARAQYLPSWYANIGSAPILSNPVSNSPQVFTMNAEFINGNIYEDGDPFHYKVYYAKNDNWESVPVRFVQADGTVAIIDGKSVDSIDFPFNTEEVDTGYYTNFYSLGGKYIPPLPSGTDPRPDLRPIGYYAGSDPTDVYINGTSTPYTLVYNFSNFSPSGVLNDATGIIYIIYADNAYLIKESYHKVGTPTRLAPDTQTLILSGVYDKNPRIITGYVLVGFKVTGLSTEDEEEYFDFSTSGIGIRDSQNDPSLFHVSIDPEKLTDNTQIIWYYEEEIYPGTGIPKDDGIIITRYLIGQYTDDTTSTIDFTNIYSRKYSVTNPTSLTITNDSSTGIGTEGDPNHTILIGGDPAQWIFDPTSGSPEKTIMEDSNTPVYFYYDIDIQGNGIADKDEKVIEQYYLFDGTSLSQLQDPVEEPHLYGTMYTSEAPYISGYVAVGWCEGTPNSGSDITFADRDNPVTASFIPTDTNHPDNTITFIYRPAAEPVMVQWVGLSYSGNEVLLHQMVLTGYIDETITVKRDDAPIDSHWKIDLESTTTDSPDYQAGDPDYFVITLVGTTNSNDYIFGFTEDKQTSDITVIWASEDGELNFTFHRTMPINSLPYFERALDGFYGYTIDGYSIIDAYGNEIASGDGNFAEVDPRLGDLIVTFHYISTMTFVTIMAVDDDESSSTYGDVLFEETDYDVEIGMTFMAYAPYIEGYVLMEGEELVKRIPSVPEEGIVVKFNYKPIPETAITVFLCEIDPGIDLSTENLTGNEPIIKVLSFGSLADFTDAGRTAAEEYLSGHYYTLKMLGEGEDDWYSQHPTSLDLANYCVYYTKNMMDIVVMPVDEHGDLIDYDRPSYKPQEDAFKARMGELFTPIAPLLVNLGYSLTSNPGMDMVAAPDFHPYPGDAEATDTEPDMDLVAARQYHTYYDKVTNTLYVYCIYEYVLDIDATVVFDYNRGAGAPIVTHGHSGATFTVGNPERWGYTFNGWEGTPALEEGTGDDDGKFSGTYGEAGSLTVYTAQWTRNSYTVTFNDNADAGGEFTNATADAALISQAVLHRNTVAGVPSITPNPGWKFVGWQATRIVDEVSTEIGLYDNLAVSNLAITYDITFTAVYEEAAAPTDDYLYITIVGQVSGTGGMELYSYEKRIALADLDNPPCTLQQGTDVFAIPGYILNAGQDFEVTAETGTYTFLYTSTTGTVKITLKEQSSGKPVGQGSFNVAAVVNAPFSYYAPDVDGYRLVSSSNLFDVPSVAADGTSEIVYEYAKIQSIITVKYLEFGTERFIATDEIADQTTGTALEFFPELELFGTYTLYSERPVLYDFNGSDAVPVTVYYTKDLVDISITAVDDVTNTSLGDQEPLKNQRKGEVVTVTAPDIDDYVIMGGSSRLVFANDATNVEFRYRNTASSGVVVQVRVGSATGELLVQYVIPATEGSEVTIDPSTIQIAGYMLNPSSGDNNYSAIAGDGDDIIVIMTDVRLTITLQTKVGASGDPTTYSTEKVVSGSSKTVYAPHIDGYIYTGYVATDGLVTTVGTASSLHEVILHNVDADVTVTFFYVPQEGNLIIFAVDEDTGDVIGYTSKSLETGETFIANDENAPTKDGVNGMSGIPALENFTLVSNSGDPANVTYDGVSSLPVVIYEYARKMVTVTLEAWDKYDSSPNGHLGYDEDTKSYLYDVEIKLPAGLPFNYLANDTLLRDMSLEITILKEVGEDEVYQLVNVDYAPVIVNADGSTTIKVYYTRAATLYVDLYLDSRKGDLLVSLPTPFPFDVGHSFSIEKGFFAFWVSSMYPGYAMDINSEEHVLDKDHWDGKEHLIVIVNDVRATLKIMTQIGEEGPPTLHSEEKLVKPFNRTISAPYLSGYELVSYQINNEEPVKTGTLDAVVVTDKDTDSNNQVTVTFIYAALPQAGEFFKLTVIGAIEVEDDDDIELYRFDMLVEKDKLTSIYPLGIPGFILDASNGNNYSDGTTSGTFREYEVELTNDNGEHTFYYIKHTADVTLHFIDDDTGVQIDGVDPQIINGIIKTTITINAPAIEGYELAGDKVATKTYKITGEDDEVTFTYKKMQGNVLFQYVEEGTGYVLAQTREDVEYGTSTTGLEPTGPPTIPLGWLLKGGTGSPSSPDSIVGANTVVTFMLVKDMRTITVFYLDGGAEEIDEPTTVQGQLGTTVYVFAKTFEGYTIGLPYQSVFVKDDSDDEVINDVIFRYKETDTEYADLVLLGYYGVKIIFYMKYDPVAVGATYGPIDPPNIPGYNYLSLRDDSAELTDTMQLGGAIVIFEYEKDMVEIPIYVVLDEAEPREHSTVTVQAGSDVVIYAPHIEGYKLVSAASKELKGVDGAEEDVIFTYVTVDEYVTITVTGKDSTDATLYSFTFYVNTEDVEDGKYTIPVGWLPNLAPTWVLDTDEAAKLVDIDVSSGSATVGLVYVSGMTTVTVKAVFDDGTYDKPIPGFAEYKVDAAIGTQITIAPPSITGYNHTSSSPAGGTITPVATETNNVVTFYYKKASGNVTVIAVENVGTFDVEIGRYTHTVAPETSTALGTFVPTTTEIPALLNYTYDDDGAHRTTSATYNGVDDVTIVYCYTRNTVTLTLKAFSTLTNAQIGMIEFVTAPQRVLENYDFSADIPSLTAQVASAGYSLAPLGSTLHFMLVSDNEAKVYYSPAQSGTVMVEVRIGTITGDLLQSFSLPAAPGETIKFDSSLAPDLSALGLEFDKDISTLEATEGVTGDKIILVYTDNRYTVMVYTNIDGANDVFVAEHKVVDGADLTIQAPYIAGYVLVRCEIDDDLTVSVWTEGVPSEVPLTEVDSNTYVTFFYQSLSDYIDDQFVTITVEGVVDGVELYSYDMYVKKSNTATISIDAFTMPGYRLLDGDDDEAYDDNGSPRLVTPSSDQTVTFEYKSLATTVAVKAYLTGGTTTVPGFVEYSIAVMAGTEEFTVAAPAIKGYQNVAPLPTPITVPEGGMGELVFYYAAHSGNLVIEAKEQTTGVVIGYASRLLITGGTFTASNGNAPTTADIPALANYTLVPNSGNPATVTYDGVSAPVVTYEYTRNTANVVLKAYDVTDDRYLGATYDKTVSDLQRVGELYDYASDRNLSIPNYELAYTSSTSVMVTSGGVEVKVYYMPLPEGQVPVDIYVDSAFGSPLQTIYIDGYEGDLVEFDPMSLSIAGYEYDSSSGDNRLSITYDPHDPDNDRLIVIVKDIRATLIVKTQLGTNEATTISTEMLVKPFSKTLYAPYVGGYVLVGHDVDGVTTKTGTLHEVILSDVTENMTTVTFLYQPIDDFIADQFVTITVEGKVETKTLYSYDMYVKKSNTATISIDAFTMPGYRLLDGDDDEAYDDNGSPRSVTPSSNETVTFEYKSLATIVTVKAYLEGGTTTVPGFTEYTVDAMAGTEEFTVAAPAIAGYQNVAPLPTLDIVSETQSENILIFYYAPHTGNLIIKAVEAGTGVVIGYTSMVLETGDTFTVNDDNAPTATVIPALANYTLVSITGEPEIVTFDGTSALEVTYEYTRKTASVTLKAYDITDNSYLGATYDKMISGQLVGKLYDYAGDRISISGYTLANTATTNVMVTESGVTVNVYYMPIPEGHVVVEVYLGSTSGELLQWYTFDGEIGEPVDISGSLPTIKGYEVDGDDGENGNVWTIAEWDGDEKLIVIMKDVRATLTVYTKLGSDVATVFGTPEKIAVIDFRDVYAPYIGGYVLTGYQVDDNPVQSVTPGVPMYVPIAFNDNLEETTVTFFYTSIEDFIDGQFVTATVKGVDEDGNELKSYDVSVPMGVKTSVVAQSIPGYALDEDDNRNYKDNDPTNTTPGNFGVREVTLSANGNVTFYYKKIEASGEFAGLVPVEVRVVKDGATYNPVDATTYHVLQNYVIPTDSGDTITVSATDPTLLKLPDYSLFGYVLDETLSNLEATEGTADKIIAVYRDSRWTVTVRINTSGTTVFNTEVKAANNTQITLFPPYVEGKVATTYSLNGGATKVAVPPAGLVTTVTNNMDIIWYYGPVNTGGGSNQGNNNGGTTTIPPITEPPIVEPPIVEPPIVEPPDITDPPGGTDPPIIIPPDVDPPDDSPTAWAPLNLAFALMSVLIMIALLVVFVLRHKEDKEAETQKLNGGFRGCNHLRVGAKTISDPKYGTRIGLWALSLVVAVVAVIFFLLTEDMSLPVVAGDQWTPWQIIILLVSVIIACLSWMQYKTELDVAPKMPLSSTALERNGQ